MGSACCQEPIPMASQLQEPTPVEVKVLKKESNPSEGCEIELTNDTIIQKALNSKKPFDQEIEDLKETFKAKDYANGTKYLGQLDEEKPNGLGKLFKNDGSIIIGHFREGILHGKLFYANRSGVICQGEISNGTLNCKEGSLETLTYKYFGGFKNNLFHGKGVYTTENSKFQGIYVDGKPHNGMLSWANGQNVYMYEGGFDENQKFSGDGRLIEPFGQYQGQFLNGKKHGKGKYTFASKLVYLGQYREGVREGKGKLINKDGSLSYQGDFHGGLPHGNGKSFKSGSTIHEGRFFDGISEQLL